MLPVLSAKPQFVVVRDVNASSQAVFEALTSQAGMQAWVPLCRSVEWRHPIGRSDPGEGSVRHIVLRGGLVAAERIIGWEQGRELRYTFDASSIPLAKVTTGYVGATRVEGDAARARLTWSIYFESPGWQAAVAPLLRLSLRGFIGLMAGNVRRIAEAKKR